MSTEEFDLLTQNSQPHEVFQLDWANYDSLDFGNIFLPKTISYRATGVYYFDGASLFSGIRKANKKTLPLNNDAAVLTNIGYTYPKGVLAADRKERVNVAPHEVATFMEIDLEDNIDVSFKFGKSFKKFLTNYLKDTNGNDSVSSLEQTVYKTNAASVQNFFQDGLIQYTSMQYVLDKIGIGAEVIARNKAFIELQNTFTILADEFGAGFVKEKHPEAFGHGDIELEALKQAGFTLEEIDIVYYGNWLRDFSQVIVANTVGLEKADQDLLKERFKNRDQSIVDIVETMPNKPSQETWVKILKYLAVKEFVYNPILKKGEIPSQSFAEHEKVFLRKYGELTQNVLGIYRPEEHLDNPKGLKDESVFGDSNLNNPIQFLYELPEDEEQVKTLYAGTNDQSLEINPDTMMKRYLKEDIGDDNERPSSFTYFSEQMKLAKEKGKSREGLKHFGAALHVLEDYFAHSNFIEIALIKNGNLEIFPWVQLEDDVNDLEDGKVKASKIPVVTGLFGLDDTVASITPKLAEEFFSIDFEEYVPIKSGERTFFDSLITTLLEDLVQKQLDVPKEQQETYLGFTYKDILDAYNGLLAFRDFWARQEENDVYGWMFRLTSKASHYLGQSLQFYNNVLFNIILNSVEDGIKEEQTRTLQDFGSDPSHTQIAKDPVDHPLNPLAGKLSVLAVKDVGIRMRKCWLNNDDINDLISYIEETYFIHPSNTNWMDDVVVDWAKKNEKAIRIAQDKTAVYYHERQVKKNLEKFEKEIENIKNPPKNN